MRFELTNNKDLTTAVFPSTDTDSVSVVDMLKLSKERQDGVTYITNLSGGKDSACVTDRLMREGYPLDQAVFFDTGMEFGAIYRVIDEFKPRLEDYGAKLVILKPETDFLTDMLLRPINVGKENEHYGYEWCGGVCRWRTHDKVTIINKYLSTVGDFVQYMGIAADEPQRIRDERNKVYPLVEWNMIEKDALAYCYEHGINWKNNPDDKYDLYQLLDRVSCWCCANKNLRELRNIYHFLPDYWLKLKALQSRIDRPFHDGKTIFDLEERFKKEDMQMSLFEMLA